MDVFASLNFKDYFRGKYGVRSGKKFGAASSASTPLFLPRLFEPSFIMMWEKRQTASEDVKLGRLQKRSFFLQFPVLSDFLKW